jgi:Domain of unknown function (DUF4328)
MPVGGADLRRSLSGWLIALLGLSIVALILLIAARGKQYGLVGDVLDALNGKPTDVTQQKLDDADQFYAAAETFFGLCMLAAGIVWMVWFRRLRQNAEVFAPGRNRFGIGWAAGAWICPVVNFWFPKQIANDIWRASAPQGPQAARRDLLNAWWWTYLVSVGINWVASVRYQILWDKINSDTYSPGESGKSDIESLRGIVGMSMAGWTLLIVAGVLAILLVRQITEMQARRAMMGPQAPAGYGYPGPGAPSYPAPGAPSYPAPGAPSYPAPGAPSYPAPGAPSYPAPGAPGGAPYASPPVPPPGQPGQSYPPYGQG